MNRSNVTFELQDGTRQFAAEQGPDWLAAWLVDPPAWVNPSIKLLAAVVACAAAYRLYQRDWHLEISTQVEMARVVEHVLAMMVATLLVVNQLDLPFHWDLALGVTAGAAVVLGGQAGARRVTWPEWLQDPRERVTALWALLGAAGMLLPPLVGLEAGSLLASTRWYVVALSFLMTIYNAALASE